MRPYLIYKSLITSDDKVQTKIFPKRDPEQLHHLQPLVQYSRSQNLTRGKIIQFAKSIDIVISPTDTKPKQLEQIQHYIDNSAMSAEIVADKLAEALYLPEITQYLDELPKAVKERSGIYRV